LNSIVKAIPNRRWDGKNKYWSAPAIRANVSYLKEKMNNDIAIIHDSAKNVLENYDFEKNIRTNNKGFPISKYPFKTKPRQQQLEALNKIYGNRTAALFMDMRTGKTKVVIDFACAMNMESKIDRVLVICPLSIRKNWQREINTHAPNEFGVDHFLLDTFKPSKFDEFNNGFGFKWLLVGVESLAAGSAYKYCERFLLGSSKSLVVVDESSKIKNHSATRSKRCVSLGRMSEYRIAMTGTPIANGPMDLFMQFEFLDPDIIGLGDFYSFRNRYAVMGGYDNRQIIGYENLDELLETIEPFIFQVRKNEVFPDSPDKIYVIREVELNEAQRKLYNQIKRDKMVQVGEKSLIIKNSLEKMLRLQEVTGGIVTYEKNGEFVREFIDGENPKINELIECTKEYDGSTIVWCAYKEEINIVVEQLRKEYDHDQVVELHGNVSEEDRDININHMFQTGRSRFLVANAATGGMGLTMSKAEVEIYYSNTFNFIDREQSEERAFSPDHKRGTIIIDIVASKTVDEHILKALTEKKDISEYVRSNIDTLKESIFDGVDISLNRG